MLLSICKGAPIDLHGFYTVLRLVLDEVTTDLLQHLLFEVPVRRDHHLFRQALV